MPRLHHLLLPGLALVFLATYQMCLVDLYAYEGMVKVDLGVDFWIRFILTMLIIFMVFPSRIERPSDLFLFFYLLISVLWGTVLWQGTGLIQLNDQPLFFLVIILPVFAVLGVRALFKGIGQRLVFPVQLASSSSLPFVLAALLIIGGLAAFITVGGGSFDWQDMYVRRIAGREAYANSVLAAYATNMATNGVLPILGFIAGYRRSILLTLLATGFVLMMFFLLGLKSPAINFIALAGLGFCFRYAWLRRNLVPITLSAILSMYVTALAAFLLSRDIFLADYLVRRISMVQPQVQSYYFDFWQKGGLAGALFPTGEAQSFSDTTFAIGYLYLHNAQTNANTNAFIYSLGNSGVLAYLFAVIAVALILAVIDAMAEKTRGFEFFAITALFSILLSEQAWTTVLLTSGIALCLALVMLFSYPSRRIALTAR